VLGFNFCNVRRRKGGMAACGVSNNGRHKDNKDTGFSNIFVSLSPSFFLGWSIAGASHPLGWSISQGNAILKI
jgi:hypothetical protein